MHPLFSELEIEYNHTGDLLRVADFELLDAKGTRLALVREEPKSWRWALPAGAFEAFISRTLAFVDPSGEILMRCVRPRFFSQAHLSFYRPGAEEIVGLREVHAVRRMRFAASAPPNVRVGVVAAESLRERRFMIRDPAGDKVGEVWMTSTQPRGVLTYRLVLSDDVSWPLRVAAIGFIPGFHATRGAPLVPTPA
jgi:hypothetical protein